MEVLILGGTRFMGHLLAWRLVAGGHRVTLFHRGTRTPPFADRVETLLGDRATGVLPSLLKGRAFDATVDFGAYTPSDVEPLLAPATRDALGHYVMISTGQVYLVRAGCPKPAREEDYEGPVMVRPDDDTDGPQWDYGAGKRRCEDLVGAELGRATRVRLPVVNGPRDPQRRMESYLWRLVDGAEILLPDGGETPMRHVFSEDVARAVAAMLGDARTYGQAYNLVQDETPTLRALLEGMAARVGATPTLVRVTTEQVVGEGLVMREVSPFTQRWMSFMEGEKAKAALGFQPTPLWQTVDRVVSAFLAHPTEDRPAGYAHRAREVALARRVLRGG
ncbi:MAG: NAD-dependent epimerase/dehydratase family protein [Polyangiales bacterium]